MRDFCVCGIINEFQRMPRQLPWIQLLVAIFFLICGGGLHGQAIQGKVLDLEGEAIAYVRIQTKTPGRGTMTAEDGSFRLVLSKGTHWVHFQHLGYLYDSVKVSVPSQEPLVVTLRDNPFSLQVVEISGGKKDPAYEIMRQMIEHKAEYKGGPTSFSCQSYVKATLREDTATYYKAPRQFRWPRRDSTLLDSAVVTVSDTLEDFATDNDSLTVTAGDSLSTEPIAGDTTLGEFPMRTFVEMRSQSFFQAPGLSKTVVEAYRDYERRSVESGNTVRFADGNAAETYRTELDNPFFFLPTMPGAGLNLYQNLVQILQLGDRPFVSPLHSTLWQLTYRFRLVNKTYEDGQVIYEIEVTPRNREGQGFAGTIWVVDRDWVIREMKLEILPSALNVFQYFTFHHRYQRDPSGQWLLNNETYEYALKDGRILVLGETFASYENYDINPSFPKNFFRNELLRADAIAFERDSSYWEGIRPMALSSLETNFVVKQDSIKAYHNSDAYLSYQDSIYNRLSWRDVLFNGMSYLDRAHGMHYFLDPLASQPRPFGVGGYRHALGGSVVKTWDRANALSVRASTDYGFNNRDLKAEGRVGFLYDPRHLGSAFVRGGDVYSIITQFTNLGAILSRSNFINKVYVGAGHQRELINGLTLAVSADYSQFNAIDQLQLAEWGNELFGELNIPQSFDPFRQLLVELVLSYTPFQKYFMEPYRKVNLPSPWPTFTLTYKQAIPGIAQSSINFSFVSMVVDHEFRPGSFGISRWRLHTGTFPVEGNLRFTDYTFFRGSDPFLFANPLRAFQLLGPTISTPNEYLEFHYLHDFGGALVKKIPLLKKTPLMITVGGGSLLIRDGGFFHSEAYLGMQWPFRIKSDRFKIGVFYVTAYSNYEESLSGQWKIGATFYNPMRKRWEY